LVDEVFATNNWVEWAQIVDTETMKVTNLEPPDPPPPEPIQGPCGVDMLSPFDRIKSFQKSPS
jgi:hypothetical protein